VTLIVGFIVIIGAAIVLDLLAAYAEAGGWFPDPAARIYRLQPYGILIADIIWFSALFVLESWRFVRGMRDAQRV
jgi:hypothetical protein